MMMMMVVLMVTVTIMMMVSSKETAPNTATDGIDDQISAAMSNPDELIQEQEKKRPDINHIDFNVEYIHPESMPRPVIQILGRKTDDIEKAYTAACGKLYR